MAGLPHRASPSTALGLTEQARLDYRAIYSSSETEDWWHAYSTFAIQRFLGGVPIDPTTRILNAGSGGWTYELPASQTVPVDLVPESIRHLERPVSCDLHHLPFEDASFDLVLCVGSVLNYTDAPGVIRELTRVTRPSGTLVLEFENKKPGLWNGNGSLGPAKVSVSYLGHAHEIFLYPWQYLFGLFPGNDLTVRSVAGFHYLPIPATWPAQAGAFQFAHRMDRLLSHVSGAWRYASNILVRLERG